MNKRTKEQVMRRTLASIVVCVFVTAAFAVAQGNRGGRGGTPQPLDISGSWTGTWSNFNPAQSSSQPNVVCAKLDAKVALVNGVWEATFEGDCGRPYKYSIKMEGRQTGN